MKNKIHIQSDKYSQTSEAQTWESSNTTENSNKNLGPEKNALNLPSSTLKKSHTVKLELSNTFHGPKRKITLLFTWERLNKGLADRLVDKCC